MDKAIVDQIITEAMPKIFGYALSKTLHTDKAEELAARITFACYGSLLKSTQVQSTNGYIYRISQNVYARFVDEEVRGRTLSLDDVILPSADNFVDDLENDEIYIRLRREISFLGKTQREIVLLYYFQKRKQHEIAALLNIPLGTVKWHLHDARNQLKEGIHKMRDNATLGIKPIRFASMGHSGNPGPDGKATEYYLSKLLTQNVAYAAYREAKSCPEIAEILGVPAAFVEDEVAFLEEYGFMEKMPGGKYLTNIFITKPEKEVLEQEHAIYTKYARLVCEQYTPLIFDAMASYPTDKIYTPERDFNFLMWSAVTYACGRKLYASDNAIDLSPYSIKRKDGSDYIANAGLDSDFDWESLSFQLKLYNACGEMTRSDCNGAIPYYAWQLNTYYDNRQGGWQDNRNTDYLHLCAYIMEKINKEPAHAELFKRLFDKGYLVSKGHAEYVNMLVVTLPEKDFLQMLPSMPQKLQAVSKELDAEIFQINKPHYPPHMQNLCRARSTNCLADAAIQTRVLEQLAAADILKPLTETQKASVNTILFCENLPR